MRDVDPKVEEAIELEGWADPAAVAGGFGAGECGGGGVGVAGGVFVVQ